jgi:rubrerythrin
MSLADYALQVAIQMEQLGHTFYESLAASRGDWKISLIAVKLAEDEFEHLRTFENMRNALPDDQRGPKMTDDQIAAAADKFHKLILPTPDEVRRVALSSDRKEVLQMAIKMETDSIAYYKNLLSAVGKEAAILKKVIDEEKKHINTLRDYLKKIG